MSNGKAFFNKINYRLIALSLITAFIGFFSGVVIRMFSAGDIPIANVASGYTAKCFELGLIDEDTSFEDFYRKLDEEIEQIAPDVIKGRYFSKTSLSAFGVGSGVPSVFTYGGGMEASAFYKLESGIYPEEASTVEIPVLADTKSGLKIGDSVKIQCDRVFENSENKPYNATLACQVVGITKGVALNYFDSKEGETPFDSYLNGAIIVPDAYGKLSAQNIGFEISKKHYSSVLYFFDASLNNAKMSQIVTKIQSYGIVSDVDNTKNVSIIKTGWKLSIGNYSDLIIALCVVTIIFMALILTHLFLSKSKIGNYKSLLTGLAGALAGGAFAAGFSLILYAVSTRQIFYVTDYLDCMFLFGENPAALIGYSVILPLVTAALYAAAFGIKSVYGRNRINTGDLEAAKQDDCD